MSKIGPTELVVLFIGVFIWLVPIAAGVWAIITLHRIHSEQRSILSRLEEIESAVRKNLPQQ
ncbi:MAG: hypothetical protein P8Y80_15575 [Acidobacteriota bacterium]|jgi:hypothetical protein